MASYTATRKLYTLIVPVDVDSQRILLGYKKRGFGEGKCRFAISSPPFFRSRSVSNRTTSCRTLFFILESADVIFLDNGFGGKVEPGETIAEGAIRELEV